MSERRTPLRQGDDMKRMLVVVLALLGIPALAFAHVTVRPAQSKSGTEERYTVRVPTEGQVATTSLQFDVPAGVTITDVPADDGVKSDVKRSGDRIVSIVWTKDIPPKQAAEFTFVARNPASGEQIAWKARQIFSDGTSRVWTPPTKLIANAPAAADASQASGGDAGGIERWLKGYVDGVEAALVMRSPSLDVLSAPERRGSSFSRPTPALLASDARRR